MQVIEGRQWPMISLTGVAQTLSASSVLKIVAQNWVIELRELLKRNSVERERVGRWARWSCLREASTILYTYLQSMFVRGKKWPRFEAIIYAKFFKNPVTFRFWHVTCSSHVLVITHLLPPNRSTLGDVHHAKGEGACAAAMVSDWSTVQVSVRNDESCYFYHDKGININIVHQTFVVFYLLLLWRRWRCVSFSSTASHWLSSISHFQVVRKGQCWLCHFVAGGWEKKEKVVLKSQYDCLAK